MNRVSKFYVACTCVWLVEGLQGKHPKEPLAALHDVQRIPICIISAYLAR